MKTTRYFKEVVLQKRPYVKFEWCIRAKNEYIKKEIQSDGRIRYWLYIEKYKKFLRVVYLEDNETVHNAFFDRNFKKE